jgi:hypothetical protein
VRVAAVALAAVVGPIFQYGQPSAASGTAATISLNPSTTFQTFDGWEATAQATQIDGPLYAVHPGWANDSPVLMDLLVNDLGLTRLRVSVVSGSENPIDYYQQFKDRLIDRPSGWNPHLYDVVNDNNDPFVTDASKFHWTELDEIITMLAVPFRAKVIASGQTPYIDLCYTDFKNVSTFKHSDDPNEYAEFVLAAFQHIQAKFGWVPNGLEIILEGDIAERWQDPVKIGRSLAAASTRLAAAGFHPEFIAPSSTSLRWAVVSFDALVGVPGVLPALKTVAYHLYWDNADENLISLGAMAKARGLKTSMNEYIGATYLHLSNDLRKANVSAWAQYQMGAYYQPDQGAKYYMHTGTTYVPGDRTRYLRQYMRYIRPGAVRIGATSATAELTPVAFINPGGRYTVVANATSAQSFTIEDLPAGTYGIRYTTATATDVNPGNQTIGSGGVLSASIPGAGAITVFSTAPGPTPTPIPPPGPTTPAPSGTSRRRPPSIVPTGVAVPRGGGVSAPQPISLAGRNQTVVPARSHLVTDEPATLVVDGLMAIVRRLSDAAWLTGSDLRCHYRHSGGGSVDRLSERWCVEMSTGQVLIVR